MVPTRGVGRPRNAAAIKRRTEREVTDDIVFDGYSSRKAVRSASFSAEPQDAASLPRTRNFRRAGSLDAPTCGVPPLARRLAALRADVRSRRHCWSPI